ncbi:MAG: hypothetical protein HY688_04525 [Chloroflexi bacterium]|nr:hypothetical protein [Chloroflexota bacterium]
MSAVAVLLAVSLTLLAIALVLWPLLRGATLPPADPDAERSDLARLREQRDAALRAIQELDGELAVGNMTAEDYGALRARHVRQAALLIREIEGREQVLDEEIERAVRRRRQRAAPAGGRTGAGSRNDARR